ncbi:MAG: hypothetical protein U1F68_09230 [Gammaproteobacteria bacterium]
MNTQQTVLIEGLNTPGVLARILLVLARRRLALLGLQMDSKSAECGRGSFEAAPTQPNKWSRNCVRIVELRRVVRAESGVG